MRGGTASVGQGDTRTVPSWIIHTGGEGEQNMGQTSVNIHLGYSDPGGCGVGFMGRLL